MGLAGLCHRPLGEGCTAQNAGDRGVAPPRRSTPGSPSSRWALEWTSSASCPAQNSRLALASLPQPDLEVRSFRNAERQYPCARPFVLYHGLLGRAPRWNPGYNERLRECGRMQAPAHYNKAIVTAAIGAVALSTVTLSYLSYRYTIGRANLVEATLVQNSNTLIEQTIKRIEQK